MKKQPLVKLNSREWKATNSYGNKLVTNSYATAYLYSKNYGTAFTAKPMGRN